MTRDLFLVSLGKGLQVALMAVGAFYFASWLIGPRLDPDFNLTFFAIMVLVGALGHLWRASPRS